CVEANRLETRCQTNRASIAHPYERSGGEMEDWPIGVYRDLPLMHDCTVTSSPGVPPRGNRGCVLGHGLHFGSTLKALEALCVRQCDFSRHSASSRSLAQARRR